MRIAHVQFSCAGETSVWHLRNDGDVLQRNPLAVRRGGGLCVVVRGGSRGDHVFH
jgi:hypothetical protein